MDALASYIRNNRPENSKLEYDRMIRLSLNWLDTHKVKEKSVFMEQEGKEYKTFLSFLEERLGQPAEISRELFELLIAVTTTRKK